MGKELCESCNKPIEIIEKPGNFYLKIMNQSKTNMTQGKEPITLWFCSWGCIETFIKEEN